MKSRRCVAGMLLALGTACSESPADSPATVVTSLYGVLHERGTTGAPTSEELELLLPLLSDSLGTLLKGARALHDADVRRAPNEKPSFADGDLFSSLMEGPSSLRVERVREVEGAHLLPVRFTHDEGGRPESWVDTVIVVREHDRFVVADVRYGGEWEFANRGSLMESLSLALAVLYPLP